MKYLIALLILFAAVPAFAQTATPIPTRRPVTDPTCGNGLPCGPIPWPLPVLPYLPSPTVFPTIFITATVAPTSIGGTTAPTAVLSPTFEIEGIEDALATLGAITNNTPVAIDGFDFDSEGLGTDAGEFFGTIRGVSELHLGPFTPLIVFLFFAFLFVLGVQASGIVIPLLMAIFGFIRRIVGTILDFIPL
jgi:hypothetical protein